MVAREPESRDDGSVWPSIIAVLGTLAGGTLTFVFQSRLASQARATELAERNRTELLDAASALGAAMLAYRHSQLARQHDFIRSHQRSEPLSEEVRIARGQAWAALYRTRLLTTNEEVLGKAEEAMARVRALKDVQDLSRLGTAGDDARKAIEAFVSSAGELLLNRR